MARVLFGQGGPKGAPWGYEQVVWLILPGIIRSVGTTPYRLSSLARSSADAATLGFSPHPDGHAFDGPR